MNKLNDIQDPFSEQAITIHVAKDRPAECESCSG